MSAELRPGDCRSVMLDMLMDGEQFHSVVTDPPYHLTSIVKRFGGDGAAPAKHGTDGLYARQSAGFMGKKWDGGDVAFQAETWRAVYDLLLPGGYLAAFGGTRTVHRMTCAIEDAGFEIRDSCLWMYGTGFPKSHRVSRGIDRELGHDGATVPSGPAVKRMIPGHTQDTGGSWIKDDGREYQPGEYVPATPEAAEWAGFGTALKPAYEPIVIARKPLIGTVAANVLAHRTGALNIDACLVPSEPGRASGWSKSGSAASENVAMSGPNTARQPAPDNQAGRWPANIIHDGSPEVLAAFARFGDKPGQQGRAKTDGSPTGSAIYGAMRHGTVHPEPRLDAGSAARFFPCCEWTESDFFYSGKANKRDRAGSKHPTVKPVSLIRWLAKLITPPGGRILDPFAGSGTTLQAGDDLGFRVVGIEAEPEYQADIRSRLAIMESQYD